MRTDTDDSISLGLIIIFLVVTAAIGGITVAVIESKGNALYYKCSDGFVSETSNTAYISSRSGMMVVGSTTYSIPPGVACTLYSEEK